MTFRVHNTQSYLTEEALNLLAENGCEVSYRQWQDLPEEESEVCREIRGVDAVIAGSEHYTRQVFRAADKLRVVARTGAGIEKIDLEAATEHGVWVTNTPAANGPAVADFTIGLILCLLRNLHGMACDMKQGKWKKFRGRELGNMTLGIVGTGTIGRQVIKRAKGFGTQILGYDLDPDEEFASEWQVRYLPLDDLMAQSDVVTIHVPLNEETCALIDERRLKLMQETAYLVDASRPFVVDRVALLKMLQAREIAGAALDVHDPETWGPDDPLMRLDNVLATPWTAYNTQEAVARMSISAARDVVAVLQGHTPKYPVNEVLGPS